MEKCLFRGQIPHCVMERVRRTESFNMTKQHLHNHYEIYYLLSGERNYFINNQTEHMVAGDFIVINSNDIHRTGNAGMGGHERILLEIEPEFLADLQRSFDGVDFTVLFSEYTGIVAFPQETQAAVKALLLALERELEQQKTGYLAFAKAQYAQLLLILLRQAEKKEPPIAVPQSGKQQKIYEIATYIGANFAAIRGLDDLCAHFFLSKFYLCRSFKEVTGFTLVEYINTNRIKEACSLLRSTKRSVTAISEQVGFETVTYFERVFLKQIGVTPRHFRRNSCSQ